MRPLLKPIRSKKPLLLDTTIRDFSGGLNVIDNDLNLSSKYAKVLKNMSRAVDGSVSIRYGYRLFADLRTTFTTPDLPIINMFYYNTRLVAVASNGEIATITAAGAISRIWDSTIAAALPGAPSGWSTTDFASAAQFNGELVVCNGSDKPILISSTFTVTYLQDLGTSSNTNTPICKYVATHGRYLVMGGDPNNADRVHISNIDTSGTWAGDPAPNDATSIDLGSVVTAGNQYVTGVHSFRDKLIVGFNESLVVVSTNIYNSGGDHTPDFQDTVQLFGSVSHRAMQTLGDDILFADLVGVPSLNRTFFTGTIRPNRVSELVDPDIQSALDMLSFASLEDRVFAVYHQREGQYFLFVPDNDAIGSTTETKCFVYTSIPTLNVKAWSTFEDWNFSCAERSQQGRIFFGDKDGLIWVYGAREDVISADRVDDYEEVWANGTAYVADELIRDTATSETYKCLIGHTSAAAGTFAADRTANPTYWELYEGEEIAFDWELPWADFDDRMKTKTTKYIGFDTTGSATFTAQMFLDNKYLDGDGNYDPGLSMTFVGGESGGFGAGEQPYGGGRRAIDERLWAWPAKFKIAKLRLFGSTRKPLNVIAITLAYLKGGIRR